jgi:integrase
MMAHALPVLGSLRLDAVTTSDCVRFLNIRRGSFRANPGHKTAVKISEGSVQRIRGFLQGFFQRAVDDGIIERNPWKTIERQDYAVRDRLLTEQEQAALLSRLSPEFQRMVRVLLGTGLRLDELRGIDPVEDLLLDERQIIVRERINENGELITRVKGGKQRVVPIPLDIVDDFKQQLMERTRLWTQSQARLRQVLDAACKARAGAPARTSKRGKIVAAVAARVAIAALSATRAAPYVRLAIPEGRRRYLHAEQDPRRHRCSNRAPLRTLAEGDVREKADRVDLGLARLETKGKVIVWAGSQK